MSLVQKLMSQNLDIIGDIHGEYQALVSLIAHLGYDKEGFHKDNRKLIFVGDLVDRGPESLQVLKLVKQFIDNGNAQMVLGNHELNLLQGVAKDGAGWYFPEQERKDKLYEPFERTPSQDKKWIYDFLIKQPLALEREDLRVVHAVWDNQSIEIMRHINLGYIMSYYNDSEYIIDKTMEDNGLLKAYESETHNYADILVNEEVKPIFLENICSYNLQHQMENPVRILTSGVEKRAETPFWASGKWRFVQRFPWWQEYEDNTPVVVGHFWRRLHDSQNTDPENLFQNIKFNEWHGKYNNVFCVDFSVGARYRERNHYKSNNPAKMKDSFDKSHLVALQWPENQLVLENGQIIETQKFKVTTNRALKF